MHCNYSWYVNFATSQHIIWSKSNLDSILGRTISKKLVEIIGGKNHVSEAKANPNLRGINMTNVLYVSFLKL